MAQQREVAIGPARRQRRDVVREGWRAAVEVDEQELVPALAAHGLETERDGIEGLVVAHRRAAEARPAQQASIERIRPRVIRTGDRAAGHARLRDELHAAMTANVVEGPNGVGAIAHEDQGNAGDVARVERARLGQVARNADAEPRRGQDVVALELEVARVRVQIAGKAHGAGGRTAHRSDDLRRYAGDRQRGHGGLMASCRRCWLQAV
jgi:hypothetical protein